MNKFKGKIQTDGFRCLILYIERYTIKRNGFVHEPVQVSFYSVVIDEWLGSDRRWPNFKGRVNRATPSPPPHAAHRSNCAWERHLGTLMRWTANLSNKSCSLSLFNQVFVWQYSMHSFRLLFHFVGAICSSLCMRCIQSSESFIH